MIIYPAIDLINGQCVRLTNGKFESQKHYHALPVQQAMEFKKKGTEWLHIIDLDGAKSGQFKQGELIKEIANKTNLKIQTGGGIRSLKEIEILLNSGIKRVIIGSLPVKQPEFLDRIFNHFDPENIMLALDVVFKKNTFMISIHGWQDTLDLTLYDAINSLSNTKIKHILVTDISRDGLLKGSNISLYQTLNPYFPKFSIQASGGITSISDIKQLQKTNIQGLVIGKAFYENTLDLTETLKIV